MERFFAVTGVELGVLLWLVSTLTGSASAQPVQYSGAVVSTKH